MHLRWILNSQKLIVYGILPQAKIITSRDAKFIEKAYRNPSEKEENPIFFYTLSPTEPSVTNQTNSEEKDAEDIIHEEEPVEIENTQIAPIHKIEIAIKRSGRACPPKRR